MLLRVGRRVPLPHGLTSGAPGALHTRVPPENQQTVLPKGVSSNETDKTSEAKPQRPPTAIMDSSQQGTANQKWPCLFTSLATIQEDYT